MYITLYFISVLGESREQKESAIINMKDRSNDYTGLVKDSNWIKWEKFYTFDKPLTF